MSSIHQPCPYDQLISLVKYTPPSTSDPHDLSSDSSLRIPPQGHAKKKIDDGEIFQETDAVASDKSTYKLRAESSPGTDRTQTEQKKFHHVPESFIKDLGVDGAAVLYGFSFVLKNFKKNKRNGQCWYYDSLDELVKKHWPYMRRTSLFDVIEKLKEKELISTSKINSKGYDRTVNYSIAPNRIDQVLKDKQYRFDTEIACESGILGALIFHNIQYNINHLPVEQIKRTPSGYKPKTSKLAKTFSVSESTIKRNLKDLIEKGRLRMGEKPGHYILPDALHLVESRSVLNDLNQPPSENDLLISGSNPNESGSGSNKTRSNSNESGSFSNHHTIYETHGNHLGTQIRSAARAFLKKEDIDELRFKSSDDQRMEILSKPLMPEIQDQNGILQNQPIVGSHSDLISNAPLVASVMPLKSPCFNFEHGNSVLVENKATLAVQDSQTSHTINTSECGILKDISSELQATKEQQPDHSFVSSQEGSSLNLDNQKRTDKVKHLVSFGRKISISTGDSSKFGKLEKENRRITKLFSSLTNSEKVFISDTFLRLSIGFIETLASEKKLQLLSQNSPDEVLNIIFLDGFDYLQDKLDEFNFCEKSNLYQERMFPLFPFLEITTRGILLFRDSGNNLFGADEFTLYLIFETLSYGLLDGTCLSPEIKSLFFNFLLLRAKVTRFDNKASNGILVDIDVTNRIEASEFSGYSSESEFETLVKFFALNQGVCAEEVFFKYIKCIDWKTTVQDIVGEYNDRWHALNFKNLSQFLNFFQKITAEIRERNYDTEIPWNSDALKKFRVLSRNDSERSEPFLDTKEKVTIAEADLVRLRSYYERKRLFLLGSFEYTSTQSQEAEFKEALLLCYKYFLAPEDIVDLAVELLGQNGKRLCSTLLRGPLVKKALHAEIVNNHENSNVHNNENIDYSVLWDHFYNQTKRQISFGRSQEEVLMDSSIKLHCWFRILCTEEPNLLVIEKYRRIAILELNYKIKKFIRARQMDLSRICEIS